MTSVVSICNLALAKAQISKRINSLSEGTAEARACALHYPLCRDDALARHNWSFARTRKSLPADGQAPDFGYDRRFLLPPDFLRPIMETGEINENEINGLSYQIEGRHLLANASAPLYLRYIHRVEDPGVFPPAFIVALAYRLAVELALEIKTSEELSSRLNQLYERHLRVAANTDARFSSKQKVKPGLLAKARQS